MFLEHNIIKLENNKINRKLCLEILRNTLLNVCSWVNKEIVVKMKYFELNDKNITFQNFQDMVKAVSRRNVSLKNIFQKRFWLKVNELSVCLSNLEKEQQTELFEIKNQKVNNIA